jgi:hypothetical protein
MGKVTYKGLQKEPPRSRQGYSIITGANLRRTKYKALMSLEPGMSRKERKEAFKAFLKELDVTIKGEEQ